MKILKKIYYVLSFGLYYLLNLVQSNLFIAWDIITPKMRTNPGFVCVSVKVDSDFGLLLLSNLISMTPGTLSIDFSEDKKRLLVHYLYNNEEQSVLKDIEKMQFKVNQLID